MFGWPDRAERCTTGKISTSLEGASGVAVGVTTASEGRVSAMSGGGAGADSATRVSLESGGGACVDPEGS